MTTEKTHWKKEFNYDYMGSYSLPDGKDIILTIKETKRETVTGTNGKKEDCFVCYFKESDKPMILNRTNCKTISKVYGTPFIEDWPGHRVILGIDNVSAFGESVEALRIRSRKPAPVQEVDYSVQNKMLRECKSLDDLKVIFSSLTPTQQAACVSVKDEMKSKLSAI
jgi:hypothetical protein